MAARAEAASITPARQEPLRNTHTGSARRYESVGVTSAGSRWSGWTIGLVMLLALLGDCPSLRIRVGGVGSATGSNAASASSARVYMRVSPPSRRQADPTHLRLFPRLSEPNLITFG